MNPSRLLIITYSIDKVSVGTGTEFKVGFQPLGKSDTFHIKHPYKYY